MPSFDENKRAQAGAFENNCILNCTVHLILDQSSSEYILSRENAKLDALLTVFNQYYETNLTATQLKCLLQQQFSHPIDQELILGPVLRLYLYQLLISKKAELAPELLNGYKSVGYEYNFKKFISLYLIGNNTSLYHNFLIGNERFCENLRKKFIEFCSNSENHPLSPNKPESVEEFFNQTNAQTEIVDYWQEVGYQNYSEQVGKRGSSLTTHDAKPIFNALDINVLTFTQNPQELVLTAGIEPYSFDEATSIIDPNSRAGKPNLKIVNIRDHWEFEASSEETAAVHNGFYSPEKKREAELFADSNIPNIEVAIQTLKVSVKKAIKDLIVNIPNSNTTFFKHPPEKIDEMVQEIQKHNNEKVTKYIEKFLRGEVENSGEVNSNRKPANANSDQIKKDYDLAQKLQEEEIQNFLNSAKKHRR